MHPEPTLPLLPARSRLYNLSPHGLGTAYTESLTGYVIRLAKAHRVSVGSLLKREVHQHLHQGDPGSRVILTPNYLRSMNGLDAVAATWTRVIGELTCRNNLQCLTMFTWADVLSSRGLLRRNRAWCPSCYEEDSEPYEHLLWCLEPVAVCPRHACLLETKCPHCRQGLPVISWRSVPGFCTHCRGWLGLPSAELPASDDASSADKQDWERRVAENLGELLAKAPKLENPPGRDRIAWSLVTLTGLTEARAIARRLDINYVTAWTWSTGGVRLLVARLLLVCAKLGVSVAEFLTSEAFAPRSTDAQTPLLPAKATTIREPIRSICPEKRRMYAEKKRRDARLMTRAKRYLETVLAENASPPPTLRAVCRKGEFTTPYLYRHFPDLCRQISARWTAHHEGRAADRRERLAREVRDVATQLHERGINPSTLNVALLLYKPGAIRDPASIAALREFRRVLGLDNPAT